MENNFDIISIGLYDRSWDEVKAALKELGVTTVVDARSTRTNNDPMLRGARTEASMSAEGLQYLSLPALDGKSRDPRLHLTENLDAPVSYEKVMSSPKFREQMDELLKASEQGKVAIITPNANAYNGAAAKLVGQYLVSTTDKSVGHVTRMDAKSGLGLSSQEYVIDNSLGRGLAVLGGDYRNIAFTSDGKWSASGDVKVGRVKRDNQSQSRRIIEGEWNYGSEGEISASTGDRTTAALENARWADYTIAISNSFTTQDARLHRIAAADNYLQVRIPFDREAFLDEEGNISEQLVKRVSTSIRFQLGKLVARDMFGEREGFNPDAMKVNIVGANIARLSNEYKEMAVTQEELDKTSASLMRDTGAHLVEMTGPDQDLVNDFMSRVMSEVRQGFWAESGFEQDNGEQPTFRIAQVRTNGESGIAEAAVIACQEHGINWNIHTSKNYAWVKDNETLQGELVLDRASFENRFKQGYTADLTQEQMRDQAHQQSYLRSLDEVSLEPGLKDNQVALLQLLGFNNSEISTMIEIAKTNGEIIMDNSQMHEFIEKCGGYGISSAENINEAAVANAQERLLDLLARCEERGISFITAANPAYPQQLASMPPYTEKVLEPDVVITDGVASVELVEKKVESVRPAILWYQGDLELLKTKAMALYGREASSDPYDLMYGDHTVPEEKEVLAREFGREAAVSGVTTVATLQDGSQMTAVNESLRYGGKAVIVSPQPLTSPKLSDYKKKVVENGGLVISEQAPVGSGMNQGLGASDEKLWEGRARRLTAPLAGAASFIEGFASKRDMNLVEGIAYLGIAVTVFATRRTGRAFDEFKRKFAQEDNIHTREASADNVKAAIRDVAPKKEKAQLQSQGEVKPQMQMPVQVLRMEGRQPIFLVSSSRPDIRQAIIKECGNNVQFAAPSAKAEAMAALYGYPEGVKWSKGMGPYYGGASAAIQKPMVHEDVVFFDKGAIHTLASAPDKYPGLKRQKTRQQNISAFESFRAKAQDLQDRFQTALDMPDSAPLYLAGSRYLAIAPNSVEIREGSELKARVYLSDAGMIRFENIESLSAALGEYGQSERPLLTGRIGDTPQMLENLLGQMEEALFKQGQGESDQLALADREEQEALSQEITTGFRSPGSDNVDLASVDVANGIREGSLADMKLFAVPDTDLLYYDAQMTINGKKLVKEQHEAHRSELYADYEQCQASVEKEMGELASRSAAAEMSMESLAKLTEFIQLAEEDASLDILKARLDEMTDADSQLDIPSGVIEKCRALLEETEKSRRVMDEIQSDTRQMRVLDKEIAALESVKGSLAKGEKVRLAAKPDEKDVYLVGGTVITIPQHDHTGIDRAEVLRDMSQQKSVGSRQTFAAERTEVAALTRGQALKEEVVSDSLSNGILIVSREGRMAYADTDLNIISDFYDQCRPFSGNCGRVMKDGKVNLISRSGNEILGEWALGIGGTHEGFAQVKREDGKMNLINMDSFQFVGDKWFSRLDIVCNGLALVGNERGQFNYLDTDGKLFSRDEWFAQSERFCHGEARITCLDGTEYTVNTTGEAHSTQVAAQAQSEGHAVKTNTSDTSQRQAPATGQKLSR